MARITGLGGLFYKVADPDKTRAWYDNLDELVAELEAKGIEILGRQDEDYGRFAWILDPDGVKVELWQQLGPAPD